LPEADAPLTLQLYCPIEERNVLTATGLESGSAYDLTVPAWNRQYRLDVFDAHGELVLSTWLGHLRTH
ncbi:MAG: hypothetical protein K9N49_04160, partial [Candidatus Marinimicrobia bacterium]|nr:hypothetical protein [Candidatus Neomarinimicrobiota bacterium]